MEVTAAIYVNCRHTKSSYILLMYSHSLETETP